jgi:hypothetical protein
LALSESGSARKKQGPARLFREFIARFGVYIRDSVSVRALGAWTMRLGGRRLLGVVAIYAIAMHAILWGAAAPTVAAPSSADPFSFICHGAAGAADEQSPATPAPSRACDHCTLGTAAAPPPAPGFALIGSLTPARVLQILTPASDSSSNCVTGNSTSARGPPHFA